MSVDATSAEALVRAHARSWFGTAYVLCGDKHAAEDLVQDTLMHLLPRWSAVVAADHPAMYVRRSIVHRFIDSRRRVVRAVPVANVPDREVAADVSDGVISQESVRVLLATLPERPRAAVVLKYLCDWTDAEIARAVGCRVATVRSMTRRALLQIRAMEGAATASETPDLGAVAHNGKGVPR